MASYQLGPEVPGPFSVITENHVRRRIDIPYLPEHEKFSFGAQYEDKMCQLVHQYLELGTDDRLCYVGDPKGGLAPLLQDKFCLLEPVTTVLPGHIHYEESPNHRMLPIKVANVGAEEYFRREREGKQPAKYDKILLKDTVQFFDDDEPKKKTYENVLGSLSEFGRVLIIHRPAPMNTLPVFTDAKDRLTNTEPGYMDIIKDLQACNLDVQWEIECLPIVMPKMKWMAMLNEKFPPCMQIVSKFEVVCGMRELSEGVLKYEGDIVEFTDRLLFITACRTIFSDLPVIKRFGTGVHHIPDPPTITDTMKYSMAVTGDIKRYVIEKEKAKAKRGVRKWMELIWILPKWKTS